MKLVNALQKNITGCDKLASDKLLMLNKILLLVHVISSTLIWHIKVILARLYYQPISHTQLLYIFHYITLGV